MDYIYPKIKKEIIINKDSKTYKLSSCVRISVNSIYHKILVRQEKVVTKEIYTSNAYDLVILEILEDFNTIIWKLINYYEDFPLDNSFIDKDQITEKERLELLYS